MNKPPPVPTFEIVPPRFELGVLEPNENKELVFEIFNRSERPFSVATVLTECKCLMLDFDRGPIQPGKSAKVRSKITATTAGMRTTSARVILNDPYTSKAKVDFHYVIVPEVLLEPKKIEFGRVETGKSTEQTIRVTLNLPDELPGDPDLAPFLQHDLPITITMDPPVVSEPRQGMRNWVATLRAKLASDTPVPMFETLLVFQPKKERTFRTTMIPVTGQIVPAWYFERASLSFGVVDVGTETTRTMRFYWPGDKPPEILELVSDVPELTSTTEVDAARNCFVLTVKCLASRPGKIEGVISLKTSLSEEASKLRVNARAK